MKPENSQSSVVEKEENKAAPAQPESLDSLLEVLDANDLRHILGGGRVKYPPFQSA